MTDPKAPEPDLECDCGRRYPLAHLRSLLSAHGLAIVTEADRKVIEAREK